jgi:hypothetical protein
MERDNAKEPDIMRTELTAKKNSKTDPPGVCRKNWVYTEAFPKFQFWD